MSHQLTKTNRTPLNQYIIKRRNIWSGLNVAEIARYRSFLYVLVWRDIKVRYKQTVIGIAWVWFQPLVLMSIYSFFFGYLAKFPSGEFPYQLFILSGLIPWMFVSRCISESFL